LYWEKDAVMKTVTDNFIFNTGNSGNNEADSTDCNSGSGRDIEDVEYFHLILITCSADKCTNVFETQCNVNFLLSHLSDSDEFS
jgi:hypothetical protein